MPEDAALRRGPAPRVARSGGLLVLGAVRPVKVAGVLAALGAILLALGAGAFFVMLDVLVDLTVWIFGGG